MKKDRGWVEANAALPLPADKNDEFSRIVQVRIAYNGVVSATGLGYADLSPCSTEWYLRDRPMDDEYEVVRWAYIEPLSED